MYLDNKMDSLSSLKTIKRHYKKDSRFVNDLYTLTYDNHESLEDTVELISSLYFRTDISDYEVEAVHSNQLFTLFLTHIPQKPNENPKFLNATERLIRNANLQFRLSSSRDSSINNLELDTKRGVALSNFITQTLKKVNREQRKQPTPVTHFTRQILQTMNVTQLQIIINEMLDFRGSLNEKLMKSLIERDELLLKRDGILSMIEKNQGNSRRCDSLQ
ncbi:CLUMA_CG014288, isoform A [Clunio marinus]|uniref:CLUMA_CG014288, isoform A n=1 Tax=Clunio marinus TaxID=568069 RepID=A0A1J1IP82_9DIPT|nr:CLUMA_CG014288, isoform A [Clunio marinus]